LDLANQLKVSYIETSAKSADNIDNSFMTISKEVISRLKVNKGSGFLKATSIKITSKCNIIKYHIYIH
jgi:hypothetical protein